MLVLEQVDLSDLALALEDHSGEHSWWLDPDTGEVAPSFDDALPGDGTRGPPGAIRIEPLPGPVGYADMEEFVAQVRDPRVRDELERAISGRRAFRRFKDALLEHPALRRAWFAFHDARGERRALEWLGEQGLVGGDELRSRLARWSEPSLAGLPGVLDAEGVAVQVTRDLRRLYRGRLARVVLTGPWARGGVHPDAELSLVVVLDGVVDRWEEKRRMERIMWRHSVRHHAVITVHPMSSDDAAVPPSPLLAGALDEGQEVT